MIQLPPNLNPPPVESFTNSIGQTFRRIPAGTFSMGLHVSRERAAALYGGAADWYVDQEPRHDVTISRPFGLGSTHVTRAQFAAFVADAGHVTDAERDGWAQIYNGEKFAKTPGHHWRSPGFAQTDDHPVVCVALADATAFCDWLGAREGRRYRLPTEAQWEYACRAGTPGAYPWGDDPSGGRGWANVADRTAKAAYPTWTTYDFDDGYLHTSPAGSFRPNAWGLHDMVGNAWEWCADRYGPYAADAATDPAGPAEGANGNRAVRDGAMRDGAKRVLRGGAWFGAPPSGTAAYRSKIDPTYRGHNVGFRVAVEVE